MYIHKRNAVFQVEAEHDIDGAPVLCELTNEKTYWSSSEVTYRYSLKPGKYFLVPCTLHPGLERDFMIRIFTSTKIDCM